MSSISERLREARELLGLNQADFAAIGGASKRSQIEWEKGAATPNAAFLAAVAAQGVDVRFVVTGVRDYEPPPPLTSDELALIAAYRKAPSIGKEFIRQCAGMAPTVSKATPAPESEIDLVADYAPDGKTKR